MFVLLLTYTRPLDEVDALMRKHMAWLNDGYAAGRFLGTEINQPVVEDIIGLVAFLDTGTVTDTPGIDEYRASVGFGVRINVRQLSPVPLAFDFGFPILKQTGDQERVFSFSIDLPY